MTLSVRVVVVELEADAAAIRIHWQAVTLRLLGVILVAALVKSCSLWEKCWLRIRLWKVCAIKATIHLLWVGSGAAVIASKHHHLLLLRAEISRSCRVLMQLVVVVGRVESTGRWPVDAPLAVSVVVH